MDEISLSSADLIVLGIVALLSLVGLISAVRSYWRWRTTRPGHKRKDRIALAFPVDVPEAPSGIPEVERVPQAEPVAIPSRTKTRSPAAAEIGRAAPAVAAGPSPVGAGSGKDAGIPASGVATPKPSGPARGPLPASRSTSEEAPTPRVVQPRPVAATVRRTAEAPTPPAGARVKVAAASAGVPTPTPIPAPAYPPIADPVSDNAELVEGKTIVFHRPMPGTMRLLPGRFEIEEGEDGPAEIRFVDVPGVQPEVTFGRRRGEPFRHVQLRSLTVSREHARLTREGKDWVISNLSQTNPIVVNGVTLTAADQRRVLRDGDRIEMGEVVFRYRGI